MSACLILFVLLKNQHTRASGPCDSVFFYMSHEMYIGFQSVREWCCIQLQLAHGHAVIISGHIIDDQSFLFITVMSGLVFSVL